MKLIRRRWYVDVYNNYLSAFTLSCRCVNFKYTYPVTYQYLLSLLLQEALFWKIEGQSRHASRDLISENLIGWNMYTLLSEDFDWFKFLSETSFLYLTSNILRSTLNNKRQSRQGGETLKHHISSTVGANPTNHTIFLVSVWSVII